MPVKAFKGHTKAFSIPKFASQNTNKLFVHWKSTENANCAMCLFPPYNICVFCGFSVWYQRNMSIQGVYTKLEFSEDFFYSSNEIYPLSTCTYKFCLLWGFLFYCRQYLHLIPKFQHQISENVDWKSKFWFCHFM